MNDTKWIYRTHVRQSEATEVFLLLFLISYKTISITNMLLMPCAAYDNLSIFGSSHSEHNFQDNTANHITHVTFY